MWSPVTLSGAATKGPTQSWAGCRGQNGRCPAVWAWGRETRRGASLRQHIPEGTWPFLFAHLPPSSGCRVQSQGGGPEPSSLPGGWSDAHGDRQQGPGQRAGDRGRGRGPSPSLPATVTGAIVLSVGFPFCTHGEEPRASSVGLLGRGAARTGPRSREAERGAGPASVSLGPLEEREPPHPGHVLATGAQPALSRQLGMCRMNGREHTSGQNPLPKGLGKCCFFIHRTGERGAAGVGTGPLHAARALPHTLPAPHAPSCSVLLPPA